MDGSNFFASPRMKRKSTGPQSPTRQTEKPLLTKLFEKKFENSKDSVRQMVEATLAMEETKFNPSPSPYEIDIKLGSGVFSEVFSAISDEGGPFALKRIAKKNPKFSWKLVLREIAAGKKLQHKNIIRFRDHFETSNNVYLVMDYFAGKDLYSLMEQSEFRPLDEPLAKHLFRQLIDAIGYSHQEGVCHRDIKLENVLVNPQCDLRVIDYGLCAVQSDGYCSDYVGTADYAAPEVLMREPYNGFKADVWSCGVFLYAILYGEFPFDLDEFLISIKEGSLPQLSWGTDNPAFKSATDAAKEILEAIFTVDPQKRPTIEQLKAHPWLQTPEENIEKLCAPFFEMAVSSVE